MPNQKPPTIQHETVNNFICAKKLARLVLSSFASRKEANEERSETYRTYAENSDFIFCDRTQ